MANEVSVIIPVYNASKYIEKTLKSLVSQSFKDFEIILVDDGSEDDSVNIINEFLLNYDFTFIVDSQEDKGVSSARNRGLELASGKYIIFLDDDDILNTNHIENLYNSLINNNADLSFTYLSKINEEGKYLTDISSYDSIKNLDLIDSDEFIKLELNMSIPFSFVELMYKKDILDKYSIRFNENINYGEDTEFALKSLVCSHNVAISHEFTYLYLQRDDSITSNAYLERFDFINVLDNFAKYYMDYSENKSKEIVDLIYTKRIPKSIFGNLMFLFYCDFPYDMIMDKVQSMGLLDKLRDFKPSSEDKKFNIKIRLFLISPKTYYTFWKLFKNSI
ncbi:hypothetical protein BGI41_02605 [Methanobrevibacter sp. 87.7]|uniref:glycosyltransferase family 2 protein n=1 Tax=Methanobrevibacter sp. 87.7 TaxID=387957 RepID=UPI000B505058|nr:glycosyltransferase family 2 protein [Methanobrevibacter sp. 87.7]OWT33403.1 hypothetical protein BGI41_02605 [Methanobrevibacter sp. 87.7]